MRAFIAIDLPLQTKEKIAKLQEDLKKCNPDFKWVDPGNIHLTLRFLGNIQESRLGAVKEAIDKAVKGISEFKIVFSAFGFFPNPKRPKVFFIKTTEEKILRSIASNLEDGLEAIGFEKESRFSPHLTLARIKSFKNITGLKERIKDAKLEEEFMIKELILYKSTLTRLGPIYAEVYKKSLAKLSIPQA
jgi:2'-5' RNA ligase